MVFNKLCVQLKIWPSKQVTYHTVLYRDLSTEYALQKRSLFCIGQIEASTCSPPPPGHTPGIWLLFRPGEEGIWLSESSRGWGIWTAPSISCKIFGVASYRGGRGIRGFSWKRLCLCGQLVTRKGLKQALWRIWSIQILKFLILDSGFECMNVLLCLQWNIIPIPAIQYNNIK